MKRTAKIISFILAFICLIQSAVLLSSGAGEICPICETDCGGGQGELRTRATCTSPALYYFHCNTINDFAYIPVGEVNPDNHNNTRFIKTVDPTCTDEGYTLCYCNDCKKEVKCDVQDPLNPSGHKYDVLKNCESEVIEYYCSVCYDYYTESKPKTAHSWGEWVVKQAATTEKAGQKVRTCSACGEEQYETIPVIKTSKYIKSVVINDAEISYKSVAKMLPLIDMADGAKIKIEFKSSSPDVVSVDNSGNITANKTGSAVITVTVTDKDGIQLKDTATVTVKYTWWQWIINILLLGFLWY
ncbi:MAG: Ig-like domain-containing protein [Clostridia bacterium]|nr:Ig-like domain-containing protein [Clostridia bacterium]